MTQAVDLEVRGTHAELLAAAGADAEHALWALSFGADWRGAWARCPRADWLAGAWVLAECQEGGGPHHRRLVGWLGAATSAAWQPYRAEIKVRDVSGWLPYTMIANGRVDRCRGPVAAALDFCVRWARHEPGDPPDLVAFSVNALFDQDEAGWTPEGWEGTPDQTVRAVAHAALQASQAALTGPAAPACLRALSWAFSGAPESPELAARFAAAFPCPARFRCPDPE